MSITYHYANLSKKEWFDASAFGGSGDRHGLGLNLTARAFELLLVRGYQRQSNDDPIAFGRWADDSIAIIGDSDEKWLEYQKHFADLYVDLIPLIHQHDGFAGLAEAAEGDDRLYAQICHLIFTRQAIELESGMKERFGTNFRQRYNDVLPKLHHFRQPKDLRPAVTG
jgi:hypothetical protein